VIIGTAGHIDHGKTQLVKALTGVDTDRLPEEKRRGITIDLGFAPLALEGLGTVGVIDVPGHEDFVRSMVVGASGIDLALLVVAGDEGVMPQTREHLSILRLLQIPSMVVALTKVDLVEEEWLALVRNDVLSLFAEGVSGSPPVVSCSSRTGEGLDELKRVLGKALSGGDAKPDDLFRLPVDRAFSVKGTGTVVTGTVWSGDLGVDEVVRILPAGRATRVRRIEQHGRPVLRALAGNRAAIALAGTELSDVARGAVLVRDEHWQPTSLFEAVVTIDQESIGALTPRSWVRLHAGATDPLVPGLCCGLIRCDRLGGLRIPKLGASKDQRSSPWARLGLAPRLSRYFTTSTLPCWDALISGVSSPSTKPFTSAP